jgi:hypothetical protein
MFVHSLVLALALSSGTVHADDTEGVDSSERAELRLELSMPDPTTATLQSALVGFGSGHFYAERPVSGFVFLGGQLVGLGVVGAGAMATNSGDTPGVRNQGRAMMIGGLVFTGMVRLVETATAPHAAHRTADEKLR